MKKFMILALMACVGSSAFAQDIKAILGATDYKEALNMIKAAESSLSNVDKAQAYNKVVDLALGNYTSMAEAKLKAEVTGSAANVSDKDIFAAAEAALSAAQECDKYDQMPNEKNKVKPKFNKKNSARLAPVRQVLLEAGQKLYDSKDFAGAATAFGMYVDTNNSHLLNPSGDKSNYTQISYFAALSAYFAKDYSKADAYSDIALTDTAYQADAMRIKVNALQDGMKTKADTLAVTSKLENLYSQYTDNQAVFSALSTVYLAQNRKADLYAMIDKALEKNPSNIAAILMRGQDKYQDHKWSEAAEDFKIADKISPNNVSLISTIGACYMYLAQEKAEQISAKTKGRIPKAAEDIIIGVYNQAIEYFEKAKSLDTKMEFKQNWAYPLYSCLYRTLGEDDPKTQEAAKFIK